MRWRVPLTMLFFVVLSTGLVVPASATIRCRTRPDSTTSPPEPTGPVNFSRYRVQDPLNQIAPRDIEFHWDPAFGTGTASTRVKATLGQFLKALTQTPGTCLLARDAKNLQAVYNYFRRQASDWNPQNPGDSTSFVVGNEWTISGRPADIPNSTYWVRDRSHVDVYITARTGPDDLGGQYYPPFYSPEEDVDTGHPAWEVRHHNSIQVTGPYLADSLDLTGAGWTSPDSLARHDFDHELQHALPGLNYSGGTPFNDNYNDSGLGELWSAAAEAVAGIRGPAGINDDVPYTWPLLDNSGGSGDPTYVRHGGNNYQNRTSFMAYLAYNFLGPDTSRTLAGMRDDLVFRWNHDRRELGSLANLLGDDSCSTCATAAYFAGLGREIG